MATNIRTNRSSKDTIVKVRAEGVNNNSENSCSAASWRAAQGPLRSAAAAAL